MSRNGAEIAGAIFTQSPSLLPTEQSPELKQTQRAPGQIDGSSLNQLPTPQVPVRNPAEQV